MPNVLQSLDSLLDGYFFNSDYSAIQTEVLKLPIYALFSLRIKAPG